MAVFAYKASGAGNTKSEGVIVADTPRQARDELRARGLVIQDIHEQAPESPNRLGPLPSRRAGGGASARPLSSAQVTGLIRELSTLLAVGTPLTEALDILARQNSRSRDAVAVTGKHLRDAVATGSSLAEAMRRHPRSFDTLAVAITQVGETTGSLDNALSRLADFRDKAQSLRNRVVTALIYPGIVLTMSVVVSVLLMTVVVPNLLSALEGAGRPLPMPTRIVRAFSELLVAHGLWLLPVAAGLAATLRWTVGTRAGARAWHRLVLLLPLVGPMVRRQAILRLAVVLSVLLRSGLTFTRALGIAATVMDNVIVRAALTEAEAAITVGRGIGPALESTGVFPPVVVQVFALGQQSGRLEELLDRLAIDYDAQLTQSAARLTAVLEPLLILFLVGVVGLIGFATVLPMLEAADAF